MLNTVDGQAEAGIHPNELSTTYSVLSTTLGGRLLPGIRQFQMRYFVPRYRVPSTQSCFLGVKRSCNEAHTTGPSTGYSVLLYEVRLLPTRLLTQRIALPPPMGTEYQVPSTQPRFRATITP
jgi:hypothetical protein